MNQNCIQFEDCYFDYAYFELSVRTLAAPSSVQAKVFPPFADITFELADDFDKSTDCVGFKRYSEALSASHLEAIEKLKYAVDKLDGDDWEWTPDDIEDVLSRPSWCKIRALAQDLLEVFEIELGEVPGCIEISSGSWTRSS